MTERLYQRRRRRERRRALERAQLLADIAVSRLDVTAVVVFGSFARGDFHQDSDVDVLVIAEELPTRPLDRLALVEPRPPGVEPVLWTPEQWRRRLDRADLIAMEAAERGEWLVGSPDGLAVTA